MESRMMKKIFKTIVILSMFLMMTGCGETIEAINTNESLPAEETAALEESDDLRLDIQKELPEADITKQGSDIAEDADITKQEPDIAEDADITEPGPDMAEDADITEPKPDITEDADITEPEPDIAEDADITEPGPDIAEDTDITEPGPDIAEEADITEPKPDLAEETPVIKQVTTAPAISINEIPAYTGNAYAVINNNHPFFADDELSAVSYEYYSDLDSLGRCGVCVASIGQDIMPTEERGGIGSVKPSGWQTVKYPGIVDGDYLYNRCHLIGFQLAGENANVNNLITGTWYLNVEGMLPFENMVADFVKETGYHVMYRVTPVFRGDNLVADGVLMEADSVEDNGSGILFNVFCYNVQPGISIDYTTGNSAEDGSFASEEDIAPEEDPPVINQAQETTPAAEPQPSADTPADRGAYAVNSKNGKIHITGKCSATGNGSNAMKAPVYFGTYEEAEAYSIKIAPSKDDRKCGNCW